MAEELTLILRRHFPTVPDHKLKDVMKDITDKYVKHSDVIRLKMKLETKDKHIEHLKAAAQEQSSDAQNYWAMVEEKDKKLNEMRKYIENTRYEGCESEEQESSSASSECSDERECETAVKQLEAELTDNEKGMRETKQELVDAKKAVDSYKHTLGLPKEAKLEAVKKKIDDLVAENVENATQLTYVRDKLDKNTHKVLLLTDKVEELANEKECLTIHLDLKKKSLERTRSVLRSQRLTRECDKYTDRGPRQKHPAELHISSIRINNKSKCTNCKQQLTTIQYCEECYQCLVQTIQRK